MIAILHTAIKMIFYTPKNFIVFHCQNRGRFSEKRILNSFSQAFFINLIYMHLLRLNSQCMLQIFYVFFYIALIQFNKNHMLTTASYSYETSPYKPPSVPLP